MLVLVTLAAAAVLAFATLACAWVLVLVTAVRLDVFVLVTSASIPIAWLAAFIKWEPAWFVSAVLTRSQPSFSATRRVLVIVPARYAALANAAWLSSAMEAPDAGLMP